MFEFNLLFNFKYMLFGCQRINSGDRDLETGERHFNKKINIRNSLDEIKSCSINDYNEEIICGEVSIDINGFENCFIIENYISFLDINENFYSKKDKKEEKISIKIVNSKDKLNLCESNIM